MRGAIFSGGVYSVCILGFWGYGNVLNAETESAPSSIPMNISELSSESIRTIAELYEKEELELQENSQEYQAVSGGDGNTTQKRLYTILSITLGVIVLVGIGILFFLNYLFAQAAKRVYRTRIGSLEDEDE